MLDYELQNLLEAQDRVSLKRLLVLASDEDDKKIERMLKEYATNPHWKLLGFVSDQHIIAVIGLELLPNAVCEILHIAVDPKFQKKGIGSRLISSACKRFNLKTILAETDSDADEFYKKLNFQLIDTFTNTFGVLRFKFEKKPN